MLATFTPPPTIQINEYTKSFHYASHLHIPPHYALLDNSTGTFMQTTTMLIIETGSPFTTTHISTFHHIIHCSVVPLDARNLHADNNSADQ